MALRLSTSSKDTRGLERDNNESLQLHLNSAARSWLGKMEREKLEAGRNSKGSSQATSIQLTSDQHQRRKSEEVKACTQKHNETLRSYIQRWSIIKNSAVDVSDERAIDAFTVGLQRADLVEEMGRINPKTVSELMDIANRFTDDEDACNNKRT
jgi:hypothetical protein